MRSQAARVVRASATPWPSTAASISMLAWLKIGPRKTGLEMPAVANHLVQVLQSSRRKRGYFSRSDGGDHETLVCSAGDRPARAKVRSPVVRMAGWRERKFPKF